MITTSKGVVMGGPRSADMHHDRHDQPRREGVYIPDDWHEQPIRVHPLLWWALALAAAVAVGSIARGWVV